MQEEPTQGLANPRRIGRSGDGERAAGNGCDTVPCQSDRRPSQGDPASEVRPAFSADANHEKIGDVAVAWIAYGGRRSDPIYHVSTWPKADQGHVSAHNRRLRGPLTFNELGLAVEDAMRLANVTAPVRPAVRAVEKLGSRGNRRIIRSMLAMVFRIGRIVEVRETPDGFVLSRLRHDPSAVLGFSPTDDATVIVADVEELGKAIQTMIG
jgi:hypothetical protein